MKFSIYTICNQLSRINPPDNNELNIIKEILDRWSEASKEEVIKVKRIIGINPDICYLSPKNKEKFLVAINIKEEYVKEEEKNLDIDLYIDIDNHTRASVINV
jgi:hypothetical protein